MAVRNNPKLTDILAKFREAQQKIAGDDCGSPECVAAAVTETAPEVVASISAPTTASDVAEAAEDVENAEAAVVEAKDALLQVADEFVNEHTAALKKEAQVFGELFAASCMEQMNKTAAVRDIEDKSYQQVFGTIKEAELLQKCAEIYDEAYAVTLQKVADDLGMYPVQPQMGVPQENPQISPEEYQSWLGQEAYAGNMDTAQNPQLSPEEYQALLAQEAYARAMGAAQAEADEDEADEESADADGDAGHPMAAEAVLRAAEAAKANAEAVESIADAANLLTEAIQPQQGDVDLPKIACETYNNVLDFLANG